MSAHTPGPWRVDPTHKLAIESARNGNVGIVNLARASEADATLMAAAPDLLDACIQAKKLLEPDLDEPGRTVFWNLVGAIKKAGYGVQS